jgi:hypothetical protein
VTVKHVRRGEMKEARAVAMVRYAKEIQEGERYEGHIVIGKVTLHYEYTFEVPVPFICTAGLVGEIAKMRRIFQLLVKREGEILTLSDEEYKFFLFELGCFIHDAYAEYKPLKEGFRDKLLYGLSRDVCTMLSAPKFGCGLV